MPRRKKSFDPPSPVFVLFEVETKHPITVFNSRDDLDEGLGPDGPMDGEVIVEYYLPTPRKKAK